MVLELNLKPNSVTNLEIFLNTTKYKELAESTMSFNRRLNEERKMRIPYIDGQTGVAQKHYDNQHLARERMPGRFSGQMYSYPQVIEIEVSNYHKILLLIAASVEKEEISVFAILYASKTS